MKREIIAHYRSGSETQKGVPDLRIYGSMIIKYWELMMIYALVINNTQFTGPVVTFSQI